MNAPTPGLEYTRVSEDAAVLCRRYDFPRAVNVLQRRAPDHRRWRSALRGVAARSARALDGARLSWMRGAVRDLLTAVRDPWLQRELAVDLREGESGFVADDLLPKHTARQLWRLSERAGLPMEYLAQVTELPRAIDAEVDTARLVLDFRRTALAHREQALALSATLPVRVATDALPMDEMLVRLQVEAQHDAAARWRSLAQGLLADPG